MRIAFCHNFYQNPGGEDRVFQDESAMMEQRGHQVMRYSRHNREIESLSKGQQLGKTFWNREVYEELSKRFKKFKPDVVHFTNTFPLLSPAAYQAARGCGAAVVQTLHNYRPICPNANLIHEGKICERCIGKSVAWPAISRKCYRGSSAATTALVASNAWHRFWRSGQRLVDRFIALTQFCRQKFIQGGFCPEKVVVKQNFVRSHYSELPREKNRQVCFVGRLTREKGIETLLESWEFVANDLQLVVAGDGPLRGRVEDAARRDPRIQYAGQKSHSEVLSLIRNSLLQVVPSEYYEPFGLVVIEAFVAGTPVVVSDIGSLAEIVEHERTGLRFPMGDSEALARCIHRLTADPQLSEQLQKNALIEFKNRYSEEKNYELLLDIYHSLTETN